MKNGLLHVQTFFYDFLKIQVTDYGSFEEVKKGTSAIHGATFFFYQKGHGVAPFYFSLDKTLIKGRCIRTNFHYYILKCIKCPVDLATAVEERNISQLDTKLQERRLNIYIYILYIHVDVH